MTEYNEEDFLMLSGIQHFVFCRRQWGLIHVEQMWTENLLTVQGNLMHEKAHDPYFSESRGEVVISRAVPIFSRTLGISGECDIVEYRKCRNGISIIGKEGTYTVYPVEYKRGSPKKDGDEDVLQLTAQAMCLEEMLCCEIPEGALFYGETRRRMHVEITEELREQVRQICKEMHQYAVRGYVPKVKSKKSCASCSLKEQCLPKLMKTESFRDYLDKTLGKKEDIL